MQALGLIWGDVDPLGPDLEEVRTNLSQPVHDHGRLLYDFWRERQGHGGLIVGRDLPSRALGPVLRNLAVLEPLDGNGDFRARVAGTALLRRFGRDITGSYLSEIFSSGTYSRCREEIAHMLRTGQPYAIDVKVATEFRTSLHFEVVAVPALSPDRSTPWAVMGVFYYDWLR